MTTEHTMSLTTTCRSDVSFEQVREALQPFFTFWGEAFDGDLRGFTFDQDSLSMTIFSEGAVGPDYLETLKAMAPALATLSRGGNIQYMDGQGITYIPFGNADTVQREAAFQQALGQALQALSGHMSVEQLDVLRQTAENLNTPSGVATEGVAVRHWNSEFYGGDLENYDEYRLRMADQRVSSGQLYLDLEPAIEDFDTMSKGMLSVTLEVNSFAELPPMACAHLHFDGDACAFSLFKKADREFYLRPECNVEITSTQLNGETLYLVKEN